MTYRFLSPALLELSEGADDYEKAVPGLGADFVDEVDAAIARILRHPRAWTEFAPPFRRSGVRRFSYFIVYRIMDAEILIVSVFHERRKPMSWLDNL
jgi:toxin ParE1/3/4